MALSGSFYKNVGSHWRLQAEWSATQNVVNNTSTITLKLYWMGLDSYGTTYTSSVKDGQTSINGSTDYYSGAGLGKLSGAQKKLLQSRSLTVTHNEEGKLSVPIEAYFNVEMSLGNTYYSRVTISQTVTLNTIPRKSSLSGSLSITAGSNSTLTVDRSSSNFSHKAYLDVQGRDGSWTNVKEINWSTSETSKSTSFTTAEKELLFQVLSSRGQMAARINLHTYSGGETLGYTTTTGVVNAPAASTTPNSISFNIGSSVDINISRNDSEFTHNLYFYVGGKLIHSKYAVTTSYTWVPTADELAAMYATVPNANSIETELKLDTYYGPYKVLLTESKTGTARVVNSDPTFSGSTYTYEDSNATTKSITGDGTKIIQNASTVKVTIPAASKAVAKNGASMVNYIALLGGVQKTAAYSTSDVTFNFSTFDSEADLTLTIKAVDSRGNSVTVGKTVTMVPYSGPTLNASAKRKNGFDNLTNLLVNGSISPVVINGVQKNSVKYVQYRYKDVNEPTSVATWAVWLGFTITSTNDSYVGQAIQLDLNNANSFNVEFRVTDALNQTSLVSMVVASGKPILFIDALKKAVSIGKFASSDDLLDVAGNINADGTIKAGKGMNVTGGHLEMNTWDIRGVWQVFTGIVNVTSQAQIKGELIVDGLSTFTSGELQIGDTGRFLGSSDIMYIQGGTSNTDTNAEIRLTRYKSSDQPLRRVGLYTDKLYVSGEIENMDYVYPSLQNGWANYSGTTGYQRASYWKDKNGIVHITGMIKSGATAAGTTIFNLPEGYRPANQHVFVTTSSSGLATRIDVTKNGEVQGNYNLNTGWTTLAGISFKAEQ
jgi:Siphovirus protein of unknown function (DUF859)